MLKSLGYRPDTVENGMEVLLALEITQYDVVLMDVHMPELDGLQATRLIHRRFTPEERPRIIGLTADALETQREGYIDAGMDDYLTKPLARGALTDALRRACTVKR
jgi:CheY-like chemotaxis protein